MRTLVYIAGYNYSGSTLLALLLHAHPRMGSTGEITGPSRFGKGSGHLCSCGRPFEQCPFYLEIEKRIDRPEFRLALGKWGTQSVSEPPRPYERILYGSLRNLAIERVRDRCRNIVPLVRAAVRRKIRINERFIHASCDLLQTDILIDSSKNPMRIPLLRTIPDLQIKVIHLVRHPAGCVLSAINHSPHPPARAATLWRRNFTTCLRQVRRLPQAHRIRLRYEDLCEDPRDTCQRLCDFTGVPFDESMLSFRRREHHVWGNPMRLSSIESIALDRRWETSFSHNELEQIARITKYQAEACGYSFTNGA